MNFPSSETFEQFKANPNVSISPSGQANVLEIVRGEIKVQITEPVDVLEWFADVYVDDVAVVRDWWDYEGYDKTPRDDLALLISSDIQKFVTGLLSRNIRLSVIPQSRLGGVLAALKLRIGKQATSRMKLEWEVDGMWKQALPFC